MPDSFTQLYIHHVSAVKNRQALILPAFEDSLHKYIVGIIRELGQTPIQVNGMADHIHIAARLRPVMPPASFIQKVKANSSKWINANGLSVGKFAWQVGGGTFSISATHVPRLRNYIKNQKSHHHQVTFQEEYLHILQSNGIQPHVDHLPEFFDELY